MSEARLDEITWTGTSADTIQRIMDEGILTVTQLLQYTTKELAEKIGSQEKTVDKVITQAITQYGRIYESGLDVLERQKELWVLSTGSAEFNRILGGGLWSQGVTEVIGKYSSGKSQLCFTAAALVTQHPPDKDERPAKAVFIDNEHTFEPGRVAQIAKARGYDPKQTLENVLLCDTNTTQHQRIVINTLDYILKDHNVKLVIVDGMLSHLRDEYIGRGMLADRQQILGQMLGKLLHIAKSHNIPVLLTNQVQADPSGSAFGDPDKPAGGHRMAHANKFRVRLWPGSKNTKLVMVIDSSFLAEEKTRIAVSEAGVVDEDGGYPTCVVGEKLALVDESYFVEEA